MKRFRFQINRHLKGALLACSLFGIYGTVAATAKHPHQTIMAGSASLAVLGLAAKIKNKGVELDDNTKSFVEALDEVLKDSLKDFTKSEDLEKKLKELGDKLEKSDLTAEEKQEFKDMVQSVKDHAAAIQKLKDAGFSAREGGAIMKALREKDSEIKAFLQGNKAGALTIEVKATQLPSDIEDHTIGDRVPGIGQIPVRRPFIEDLFQVVNTTKEYIKYIDQDTVVRDAKNVAGNAASTHNTKVTWKEYTIQITKVRDFIDVSIDMMDDYDFVEGEVRNLLDTSVSLKVDDGLLKGDGVYPNLHSIDEASSEFDASNTIGGTISPWTASVEKPNFFDLAVAMCSQIIALGKDSGYMPNAILINTVDKYKNMLVKDANGQYLMPPFVVRVNNKEYTIDGMVVRSNPNVDPNTMYVFDSTKGTIYNRRGAVIELSYENRSNFEIETVTLKVYRRLQLLIRNVNKNAFMKCTDVAAALQAIEKAA